MLIIIVSYNGGTTDVAALSRLWEAVQSWAFIFYQLTTQFPSHFAEFVIFSRVSTFRSTS
jgi:hypothetical protein